MEELKACPFCKGEGIELKGYKYKNHNLALRKWEKNDKPDKKGSMDFMDLLEG